MTEGTSHQPKGVQNWAYACHVCCGIISIGSMIVAEYVLYVLYIDLVSNRIAYTALHIDLSLLC